MGVIRDIYGSYNVKSVGSTKYIDWLMSHVGGSQGYLQLIGYLATTPFVWSLDRDSNRACDGAKLRDIYEDKTGKKFPKELDIEECSVLEMLIGLSIRIETDIMGEPGDDHPERWFWEMLNNLGVTDQDDDSFNFVYVDKIVQKWMNRKFSKDGKGSIFIVKNDNRDMKNVEIWDQMSAWINENYSSNL